MIRGTTPTHTFTIPFDTALIKEVRVVYAQADTPIVWKETKDCTLEGKTISTTLTQEDTLKFDCKKTVQIQIRVLTTAGEVLSTLVQNIMVEKCLDSEVLA